VTNVFLFDYETRLRSWSRLRDLLVKCDFEKICIDVDKFWQLVPTSNHYLHPDFIKDWPDPWQLLFDNTYCNYSRALGMIYTLILLGINKLELVEAVDDNSNEVVLVLVDDAKYVLNYWPGTVVNNHISDFTITKILDISPLYSKIGL
jgi:hypothetical protein